MYIKQFFVVLVMYALGEAVSVGFGLPIPGNVLGLLFLLTALCLKWIKLEDVEDTADFITNHLALIFLVPTVGIMEYLDILGSSFFQIFVPLLLSIFVGLFVAGWATQLTIRGMAVHRLKREKKRGSVGN